eukprot:jgi/Mesvir1/23739/Mv18678-RA.1
MWSFFGVLASWAWAAVWAIAGIYGLLSLGSYIVPRFLVSLMPKQNLKRKYQAEWALVTGASSGIGRSISERLAEQGINVVLVALDDDLLASTEAALSAKYANLKFRAVGADLGARDASSYLTKIVKATEDIHVSLVFNNAGYILTGFFRQVTLEAFTKNMDCNMTAAVWITHHFLNRMLAAKRKGAICFTSSAAAFIPSPFASGYGATKAFLSSFASSLAVESKYYGIDVAAVHPSPVSSRFYDKAADLDSFKFTNKFAVQPAQMPDEIFAALGRATWHDIGGFAFVSRIVTKTLEYNFLAQLFARTAHLMPDWKKQAH